MFAEIIRGKVSDPDAVRPAVERWMKELGPNATGWLGSTSGVTEDSQLFVLVRFESEEAARANSDKPSPSRASGGLRWRGCSTGRLRSKTATTYRSTRPATLTLLGSFRS